MSTASLIAWLAAGGLAGLPALREVRRVPMGPDTRDGTEGQFADLGQGTTHYRWFGSKGPVAVCIHGLTTPSGVWSELIPGLRSLGFRVLVYDLYGRGLSDRPRGPQTTDFFTRQLADLLAHEHLQEDITLIGYSMGGAIASGFAAQQGHRLRRLILIAPAGMGHELGPLARWAIDWPILGDWVFHMGYPRSLRQGMRAETAPEAHDMAAHVSGELETRGYLRSVLSSLRGILRHKMEDEHHRIARDRLPVTAIWGRDDRVIPIRAMGQLTQWNRDARHEVIEGATHALPYTHAAQVTRAIRDTWVGPVI